MIPQTEAEMRKLIKTLPCQDRQEGVEVPEGLCLTNTGISNFWYYREGNTIARLHERFEDQHVCFTVETHV